MVLLLLLPVAFPSIHGSQLAAIHPSWSVNSVAYAGTSALPCQRFSLALHLAVVDYISTKTASNV
jgi:hypothetical protein